MAWKVPHGVIYTADRLISFGYDYDPNCFCGALETPSHLFFECALAQSVLGWIQSLMFCASSSCPSLLCRHVLWFLCFGACCGPSCFGLLTESN